MNIRDLDLIENIFLIKPTFFFTYLVKLKYYRFYFLVINYANFNNIQCFPSIVMMKCKSVILILTNWYSISIEISSN